MQKTAFGCYPQCQHTEFKNENNNSLRGVRNIVHSRTQHHNDINIRHHKMGKGWMLLISSAEKACYSPTNVSEEDDVSGYHNHWAKTSPNTTWGNDLSFHQETNLNGQFLVYFTILCGLNNPNMQYKKRKGKQWTFTCWNWTTFQ